MCDNNLATIRKTGSTATTATTATTVQHENSDHLACIRSYVTSCAN